MTRAIRRLGILLLAAALLPALPASVRADDIGDGPEGTPGRRQLPSEPAPAEPAPMAATEECPTWFPDFRNCGRSGRWEGFERPIVAPFLFEDPFITTGVYPFFIWHEFPARSALGGGDLYVAAVQARVAITDRLAFIATKDGRGYERPESKLLDDSDGWFNLAFGFKYAFLQREEDDLIASAALRMEVPTGSSDIFEGRDGAVIFIPSMSVAKGFDDLHVIAGLGGQIPTDGDRYGSQIFYHLYFDYKVHKYFQPFVQFSGIYYVESGDGSRRVRINNGPTIDTRTARRVLNIDSFEGVDVHNLGGNGVDNNDFITWAVGGHIPISKHVTLSAAYERPLTSRKDIFKQRMTSSVTFEF